MPLFFSISSFASYALAFTGVLAGGIHLVERRGRREKLNPKRQVEIATVLDAMPEPVCLFDAAGRVLDVNTAMERLVGLTRDQLLDRDVASFQDHIKVRDEHNSPIQFPESLLERAFRGETVRSVRRRIQVGQPVGRAVEILVSASPMHDADGTVVGALVMARDITELIALQRRLSDTQRHNAVGQMAAGIAHDFNNVLDAITQALFLLEMHNESAEERRHYIRIIENAVRRGAEITERVREYLRSGTGERKEVEPKRLLEEVLEFTLPMVQRAGNIRVQCDLHDTPKVCGNAADLRRVFVNLIINAVEAMPQGGELTVRSETTPGHIRISVSDTGHGIRPEDRSRVFDPYFTTKTEGTGLGLSGARHIVSSLGGDLTFTSELGKGTTFTLDLPVRKQPRQPVENTESRVA